MKDIVEVPFIFYFEADENVLIERVLQRGQNSGRNDDNIDSLKKRLTTFNEQTMPIVKMYEAEGKVRHVNGIKSVDEVFATVKDHLKDML